MSAQCNYEDTNMNNEIIKIKMKLLDKLLTFRKISYFPI